MDLKISRVIFVDCFNGFLRREGDFHVTQTQTFFTDTSNCFGLWIKTCLIDKVERLAMSVRGAPLVIRGKNFHVACFIFPSDSFAQKAYESINRLTDVPTIERLPCFLTRPPKMMQGWDFFKLANDFARMGLPNASWTELQNSGYQICSTYPSVLYVPSSAGDFTIVGSANFRSRKRLPVLTWIHPTGSSVLCRSSQPLSGLRSKNKDDQRLLRCIRFAAVTSSSGDGASEVATEALSLSALALQDSPPSRSPPVPPVLQVVDTRPRLNALTNRAQGKGYEMESVYDGIKLRFFDIPNIHVVRSSLEKMLKEYQDARIMPKELYTKVDKSGWLRNLHRILETAHFVASRLQPDETPCPSGHGAAAAPGSSGFSFLVHCSDGWDRTAQVCALAQLCIDPYYRTFEGFQALVEKDWLHFGHKFSERCGHSRASDSREVSPVFTQFLEVVHHLARLCPCVFQFNNRFLMTIHDSARSGQFGTFVGCSELQRIQLDLAKKTPSLWSYLADNRHRFLNPLYAPSPAYTKAARHSRTGRPHITELIPAFVTSPHLFGLWSEMYLRREWRIPSVEQRVEEPLQNLRWRTRALQALSARLRQRARELARLLGRSEREVALLLNAAASTDGSSECVTKVSDCGDDTSQTTSGFFEESRLTSNDVLRDLWQVSTKPAAKLIPGSYDRCAVCQFLLASRTPSVLCYRCVRLVCSACYVLSSCLPSEKTSQAPPPHPPPLLPLCRTCLKAIQSLEGTTIL